MYGAEGANPLWVYLSGKRTEFAVILANAEILFGCTYFSEVKQSV